MMRSICKVLFGANGVMVECIHVRVEPRGAVLRVAPGALLLDVLRQAAIPVSYSCQAGRCGTCRCELLAGDVLEDPDCEFRAAQLPGSPRQVLACRTRLSGDCSIGLVEPYEILTHPAQTLRCRVQAVDRLNESTLLLQLCPNRPLRFSAGQFAQLDFGAGLVRPYSMASAEGEELLEFHLRHVPTGRASSFVVGQLRRGDFVKLIGPLGTSYLRRRHTGPMLCIAGGTGLAPMMSIARTALAIGIPGPIHTYVGARAESALYGIAELRSLERRHPMMMRLVVAADDRPEDTLVRHGRVTDVVHTELKSLAGWKVYLAGPAPMVDCGTRLALALGAFPSNIHADAFYPSG